jgi:DNA-binding MarR family transcriptional regulator
MNHSQLSNYQAGLRACLAKHPQMRVSQIDLLLAIKMNPGRSQIEYAEDTGLEKSSISRSVQVLSHKGRKETTLKTALNFVSMVRDTQDERVIRLYLTPSGEAFVELLMELTFGTSY